MNTTTDRRSLLVACLGVLLLIGLVFLGGCQEQKRNEKRFLPPTIGGPPNVGGPGVDAGRERDLNPARLDPPSTDLTTELASVEDAANPALGSFENPLRADGIAGQRHYLQRLRTASGNPVAFRREGTFLTPDGAPLDGFRLRDPKTGQEQLVFLDLAHPGYQESQPLPGYRLAPAKSSASREPK